MCCTIQFGRTALHYVARSGKMTLLKYLVGNCQAVITTQDVKGRTPISDATNVGRTNVVDYLKSQVKEQGNKMILMVMESDILPFYKGVRGIIVKYLQ